MLLDVASLAKMGVMQQVEHIADRIGAPSRHLFSSARERDIIEEVGWAALVLSWLHTHFSMACGRIPIAECCPEKHPALP